MLNRPAYKAMYQSERTRADRMELERDKLKAYLKLLTWVCLIVVVVLYFVIK